MYNDVLYHGAPMIEEEPQEYEGAKPVVLYSEVYYLEVGRPAVLVPIDHSNERLNGRTCTTSYVKGANADTGLIETRHTVYKPHPSVKLPAFTLT